MLTKQTINVRDLNRILNDFSLGQVMSVTPLATSGNIAYVIKAKKEKNSQKIYFLRLCPTGPRWRSRGEIAAEIEVLKRLQKRGLPVVTPVDDAKGKAIIVWNNHFGYLREYIKGETKLKPTPAELYIFGQTLGRMHAVLLDLQTKNKRRHVFDPSETMKYFRLQKQTILKSKFSGNRKFVAAWEKEMISLKFPVSLFKGIIHEDLGRRHAVWEKKKIVALIDFDRCYYGALIWDLGQAVRGWCFKNDWQTFDRKGFVNLMKGYQSIRKISRAEKKCLVDAIKFGILERALSFCVRYTNFSHDTEDLDFALDSLFKQLPLVEKNRGCIIQTLK